MSSNEVKQTEQDVLNPSEKIPNLVIYPPSAVYMRRGTGSALISRLFGANPLPEPVLTYN